MAVDQAIALMSASGHSPPTLRFYQWRPPTVSLGRHQALSEIDLARVRELGYDLVRRPTGGRAILHIDELTYSIAGPKDEPRLAGAVLDSYNRISQGLVLGLQRLGVDAVKAPASQRAGPDVSAVCFEVPSAYEILVAGKKIIGSAQSRRAGYILQHGSLPLQGDVTRLVEALALSPAERLALREAVSARATTLEAVMGRHVSFWEAAVALIDGLTSALDMELEEGDLTAEEIELAQRLQREIYANPDWLARPRSLKERVDVQSTIVHY
ncbi:MAG: lipoate--protein ligase family protein [Chloroflexi bacterium]|nr:lipoate--protein ligase family protein [Chloroflexota bacterium]